MKTNIKQKIGNLGQTIKVGWNKIKNNPSFTLKEQLGFASGTFGNSMGQDMIGTFFTLYMTKYMGIESAMLLVLSVVAKVLNIIGDPVAGAIFDRPTKSGKSRVKPFLLLSPFPLAVTSVLLFVVPAASMTFRLVWVFAFYLIYCLSDTFYDMSLMTTSTRMTNNPQDRKNFYTVAEFASALGTTLPGGVIPIFITFCNGDFKAEGTTYLVGTIIFGVLGLAAMVVPAFTLKEKVTPVVQVEEKIPLGVTLKVLFSNRPLFLLVLSKICDSIRQICYGALMYLYVETLGAPWMSTVVGSISVVFSYIGIALIPIVGKKLSARDIIMGGYFYTGTFYLILLAFGYKWIPLVCICIALAGFPNGAMGASRKILVADSTDYMEWKARKKYGTAIRQDGMAFAINSMANRLCGLWTDLLLPAGLTLIGYQSAQVVEVAPDTFETVAAVQTPETLKGIFYLVVIPGIVGNFVPGIIMLFDNFHGKRRERILEELAEMRAADVADKTESESADEPDQPTGGDEENDSVLSEQMV